MAWVLLIVAGLFEVVWALGLKYSEGLTRPVPTAITVAAVGVSMWLLSIAARTLPIGTAYAVWVGIGAAGTAILGSVLFREPLGVARVFFLSLLIVAILGLKLTHSAGGGEAG